VKGGGVRDSFLLGYYMMALDEQLRLGYACLNTVLRAEDIFSSRGIRLETISHKGVQELERLSLQNIEDTKTIVRWNEANGIRNFRLTSVLLPHFTNPRTGLNMNMGFAATQLYELGALANHLGHRITMHPDHFSYTIVSAKPEAVSHALADLSMHAEILDHMGMGPDSILCIHGPGTQGDRDATMRLWDVAYQRLPRNVRSRIALENTEHNYDVNVILATCERNGIPMALDWFHNSVADVKVDITDELMSRILDTWRRVGKRPVFHLSEQAPGKRVGTHSDMVEAIPEKLLKLPDTHRVALDIDLESKKKEEAVLYLYNKYATRTTVDKRLVWKWK